MWQPCIIYIYIYIRVCVCVCLCRDREYICAHENPEAPTLSPQSKFAKLLNPQSPKAQDHQAVQRQTQKSCWQTEGSEDFGFKSRIEVGAVPTRADEKHRHTWQLVLGSQLHYLES